MPTDLVTIATFSQAAEAHLAKGRLEADGIHCYLADEHTIGINALYSQALGGVRLQVSAPQASDAREILGINTPAKNQCPHCQSVRVSFAKWPGMLNLLAFFGVGTSLPFVKRQWHCRDCGHHWKS